MTLAPEELKSCCAAAYSSAAARFLLGDSFHPGGAALTSELAQALRVGPGQTVVDVASGPASPGSTPPASVRGRTNGSRRE